MSRYLINAWYARLGMKDEWGMDENTGCLGVRDVTREQETPRRGTRSGQLIYYS